MDISAGGVRLRFVEAGDGPELALFVHGAALDHEMWRGQLDGLSTVRRCVAIDMPGHGGSEPGRLDLVAVLDALGADRADLCGHSWGGHEVLGLWRRAPERVRSIVLCGVMLSEDQPAQARTVNPDPALARFFTERPVPIPDQPAVVASISVPLLVLTGSRDDRTPVAGCRRLAALNVEGRFMEIADAGHMAPVEQPEAVNHAIAGFWAGRLTGVVDDPTILMRNIVPLNGTMED